MRDEMIKPPVRQDSTFSVRLTKQERQALNKLADDLQVKPSHLVCHLIRQAVKHMRTA